MGSDAACALQFRNLSDWNHLISRIWMAFAVLAIREICIYLDIHAKGVNWRGAYYMERWKLPFSPPSPDCCSVCPPSTPIALIVRVPPNHADIKWLNLHYSSCPTGTSSYTTLLKTKRGITLWKTDILLKHTAQTQTDKYIRWLKNANTRVKRGLKLQTQRWFFVAISASGR